MSLEPSPDKWDSLLTQAAHAVCFFANPNINVVRLDEAKAILRNAIDEPHAFRKIVCHAEGDKCLGCDHYAGKADRCSFTPSHARRIDRCCWCDQSFACYSDPNAECSRLPSAPSTTAFNANEWWTDRGFGNLATPQRIQALASAASATRRSDPLPEGWGWVPCTPKLLERHPSGCFMFIRRPGDQHHSHDHFVPPETLEVMNRADGGKQAP